MPEPANPKSNPTNLGGWLKFIQGVFSGLKSKEELLELIETAEINKYIGPESRIMLEGVLSISEMRAGDIMVPAPRMDMLDIGLGMDELLEKVIQIGHSRYPVYENNRENIIGVLMAKDLLKLQRAPELNIKILLRTAVFVPESKNLTDLLKFMMEKYSFIFIMLNIRQIKLKWP